MSEATTKTPAKAERKAVAPSAGWEGLWQPLAALRDEMDRMFDNVVRNFGLAPSRTLRRIGAELPTPWRIETAFGTPAPAVDIVEDEKEYRITAELPGMDARDVELTLSDDMLTLRGEKKEEREEKTANYYLSERRFGSFQRSFPLPQGVDRDKIEAKFEKGVLTITLPKTPEAAARQKKIEIKQGT
ncbi:Hsp20/alpha crystallin family protein [Caldovatus aquaticus]|uniref:Hsp20/alpha crystallin family protein n=1 Tax=Caldovatus aquaticus TaxID=2865671 RepID=A0ABS7F6K9_9PROT|nr:Hsp20/alpha crystallin family protein [Caldovatus aquaticus]MBW8271148.1 Hsp20/alpha crystallin family protein [Caldovatus aquaticus]